MVGIEHRRLEKTGYSDVRAPASVEDELRTLVPHFPETLTYVLFCNNCMHAKQEEEIDPRLHFEAIIV